MPEPVHDHVVVGGGIVGLATALQLLRSRPGTDVLVLEKESAVGPRTCPRVAVAWQASCAGQTTNADNAQQRPLSVPRFPWY